ncbi:MAG: DUF4249 domain-containing protein [Janthinobacterium lividum]
MLLLALLGLGGCTEPYAPDVVGTSARYLVVDGFINGNGRTRITLSRTENIAATTPPPAERGATLLVVDDAGQRYALREQSAGFYQSDSLGLSSARQYQLRITTAGTGAAIYASDLVPLKVTPPLDNLRWQLDGDYVRFSFDTHDATGQSRYYRWGVVETWQFNSGFNSTLVYDRQRDAIVGRPAAAAIYTCWRTERSSLIKQSSTAQLSQDALTAVPLLAIPTVAERFKVRYSVLVSQMAETAAEFAYYEVLRKNTEAVGTVNDPLPSQLTGNVHRVGNTTEPVLGFVGAHTVQQQRLFINRADLPLPNAWKFDDPYRTCSPETLGIESLRGPGIDSPISPDRIPLYYAPNSGLINPILIAGSRECVDCRVRGTTVKPSFW